MSMPDFEKMEIPADILKIVELVKKEKRRILIYQGGFGADRDLDKFAEAVSKLKNEYVLFLMGEETDYKKSLCTAGGDAVVNIPYIKPPFHLLITKHADIGILPYKAAQASHFDKINALYCAPNKLFEYTAYGIPMIGTDVPGLILPFYRYDIGYVCRPYTVAKIIENIALIAANYTEMSSRCIQYYNSINMDQIVNEIINMKTRN
jgi:glycosyltransferase involved in cell wall biosynthesis